MLESKYNLGLVSVSFRDYSPQEILKEMKKAQLTHIEWGADVHAPCNDINKLQEIASLQKEYGITCSSYGTYFRLGQTPIEELVDYIDASKILGTNVIRVWCGSKNGQNMTLDEKEFLLEQCKKAEQTARKNNVILCTECHMNTFTEFDSDAVWFMETINSPHFRTYWQPFQNLDEEKNLYIAKALSPYTEHIHVFNWKGDKRFKLGKAVKEWQLYLGKFSTPRTLLLEFMPDDKIESLQIEANALRKIIGDKNESNNFM